MRTTGLAVFALLATLGVSGCTTTTEYVTLQPQCEPVVVPALPLLDRGELWDTFIDAERWREAESPMVAGDGKYRVLERYILQLWAFADEQAALIKAVCQ